MTRNEIIMNVTKRWRHKKLMFEEGLDGAAASLESTQPSFEEVGFIADIAEMFEAEGVRIKKFSPPSPRKDMKWLVELDGMTCGGCGFFHRIENYSPPPHCPECGKETRVE